MASFLPTLCKLNDVLIMSSVLSCSHILWLYSARHDTILPYYNSVHFKELCLMSQDHFFYIFNDCFIEAILFISIFNLKHRMLYDDAGNYVNYMVVRFQVNSRQEEHFHLRRMQKDILTCSSISEKRSYNGYLIAKHPECVLTPINAARNR